jgi:hypothetical protein
MTTDEVVSKLIEGLRCCSLDEPKEAASAERSALTEAVAHMRADGCAFTDDEIELATQGEEAERAAWFSRYVGWSMADAALDFIFDHAAEDAWHGEARLQPEIHLEQFNGHLLFEFSADAFVLAFKNSQCHDAAEQFNTMSEAKAALA